MGGMASSLEGERAGSTGPRRRTRRAVAYCSANDRNVPALVPIHDDEPARRKVSHRDAGRVVCLDFGVRCTGALCPLFQLPSSTEGPHSRSGPSGPH